MIFKEKKKYFFFLALTLILSLQVSLVSSQGKALIYGYNIGHETNVKNYFINSAPENWTVDLGLDVLGSSYTLSEFTNYAINNSYSIIIHPYSGVYAKKEYWDNAMANGVLVVSAHGTNNFEELSLPPEIISAVTVSGGTNFAETSYGKGLEFLELTEDSRIEQSYVTPVLAAKAAQIMNEHPTYNNWDVRQHLRQISPNYKSWNPEQGYGRPDLSKEITNLDLAPPLEIKYEIKGNGDIIFSWKRFKQSEEAGVRIYKNDDILIYSGNEETFTYTFRGYEDSIFKLNSFSEEGKESKDYKDSEIKINLEEEFKDCKIEDYTQVITNCQQLQCINSNPSWNYYLSKDIDCSKTSFWNGGKGFEPIGGSSNSEEFFTGKISGNGHVIKNLYINRPNESNVAFIEYLSAGSEIKNIGFENADITGKNNVAIVAAFSDIGIKIDQTYTKGSVKGEEVVGGFIGSIEGGVINNSYSIVEVNGNNYVGGFIGAASDGLILNSYSAGQVNGNSNTGAFSGYGGWQIINSFWDKEKSGQVNGFGGMGKTTFEMKNLHTYTNLNEKGLTYAWDFLRNAYDDSNNQDIWMINSKFNERYPSLTWQEKSLKQKIKKSSIILKREINFLR